MTELQIEKVVETVINILDRDYLTNKITQQQYDAEIEKIDTWAKQAFSELSTRGIK